MQTEQDVTAGTEERRHNPAAAEAEALEMLENGIDRIVELRRRQFRFHLFGIIAILTVLAVFLSNLYWSARQEFDRDRFVAAIRTQGKKILTGTEMQRFWVQVQSGFLPLYRRELQKAFHAGTPELRRQAMESTDNLLRHLAGGFRPQLSLELAEAMKRLEQTFVERYPELNREQVREVFEFAREAFIIRITGQLERNFRQALEELATLRDSAQQFKSRPEYQALNGHPLEEVRARLAETLLELWACNITSENHSGQEDGK